MGQTKNIITYSNNCIEVLFYIPDNPNLYDEKDYVDG